LAQRVLAYWDYDKEQIKLWDRFEREVIKRFEQYHLPVIELAKETPKEAVCQVFEKVNTGGVTPPSHRRISPSPTQAHHARRYAPGTRHNT
jgi:hypothetical protein